MTIRKPLKYGEFIWNDVANEFTIHAGNGTINLNKVYAFALQRFITRIAQRNWLRRKHGIKSGKQDSNS